jgi:hypothetical protein
MATAIAMMAPMRKIAVSLPGLINGLRPSHHLESLNIRRPMSVAVHFISFNQLFILEMSSRTSAAIILISSNVLNVKKIVCSR